MRSRRIRASVTAICILILAGVTTTGAASTYAEAGDATANVASERQVVVGTATMPPLDEFERQDAETYAHSSNISLDAAVAKFEGQNLWDQTVGKIAERFPSQFMSAGRDEAEGGAWIAIVGSSSPELKTLLTALPFDTVIRENSPATASTLELIGATALSAVTETAGVAQAGTSTDPRTGDITITYRVAEGSDVAVDALQAKVNSVASKVAGGELPVSISLHEDPAYRVDAVYAAGASLWRTDGSFACTSGFNVHEDATSTTGVITAQHCDNTLNWGESKQSGVIQYVKAAPSVTAGKIDLQYHKSINGQIASANFQAINGSSGGRRTVSSASNAVHGDVVCKWGWGADHASSSATHAAYECAEVDTTDGCQAYNVSGTSTTFCGLNRLYTAILNPGDSGGPVFAGSSARGYNAANCDGCNGGAGYSWYTQQSRVSYMGLFILLG